MAGQEFEKTVAAYKQQKVTTSVNKSATKVQLTPERPKSAYLYEEDTNNSKEVPCAPTRYSQSDILKSFRSKGNYQSASFEEQSSTMPSYSMEDLRYISKDDLQRGKLVSSPSTTSKNDSANELRQAASRYHQELLKNYPKFRHSIKGTEQSQKFLRKASMPTEDSFARGEPFRATIAMTTTARMPRSYSANDTVEMHGLHDVLKSNDNSMMSRLLRDQNSLMKIDEETTRGRTSSISQPRKSLSKLDNRSPTEMKSICIQTEPGQDDADNFRRTSDVQ